MMHLSCMAGEYRDSSGGEAEDFDLGRGIDPAKENVDLRQHPVFKEVFAAVAALPNGEVLDYDDRIFPHLEGEVGIDVLHLFLLLKSPSHLSGAGLYAVMIFTQSLSMASGTPPLFGFGEGEVLADKNPFFCRSRYRHEKMLGGLHRYEAEPF